MTARHKIAVGDDLKTSSYLFQDGFEGATLVPPWDVINVTGNPVINTDLSYVHSGSKSMQVHYLISGGGHQDYNRYVTKLFNSGSYPNGIDHFFIRGYVYHKYPETGGGTDVQRKMFYLMSPANPPGHPDIDWSVVLNSYTSSGSGHKPSVAIQYADDVVGHGTFVFWDLAILEWDTWYCMEVEVKANTPDISDGELRVWIDGTQKSNITGLLFRTNGFSGGISKMQVGDQADSTDVNVDEYRYWDDVVISTAYIGT